MWHLFTTWFLFGCGLLIQVWQYMYGKDCRIKEICIIDEQSRNFNVEIILNEFQDNDDTGYCSMHPHNGGHVSGSRGNIIYTIYIVLFCAIFNLFDSNEFSANSTLSCSTTNSCYTEHIFNVAWCSVYQQFTVSVKQNILLNFYSFSSQIYFQRIQIFYLD